MFFETAEGLGEVQVLGGGFATGPDGHGLAEAIGDIAEVAEGGGVVALEDGAVEIGLLATLDGVDVVAEVIAAALEGLDDLAGVVERDGFAEAGRAECDEAFGAVDD